MPVLCRELELELVRGREVEGLKYLSYLSLVGAYESKRRIDREAKLCHSEVGQKRAHLLTRAVRVRVANDMTAQRSALITHCAASIFHPQVVLQFVYAAQAFQHPSAGNNDATVSQSSGKPWISWIDTHLSTRFKI